MIKIDKKVPLPLRRSGRKSIYPFDSMRVGDSFEVSLTDRPSVTTSAKAWAKRKGNNAKFTTSAVGNKVRIWRIE